MSNTKKEFGNFTEAKEFYSYLHQLDVVQERVASELASQMVSVCRQEVSFIYLHTLKLSGFFPKWWGAALKTIETEDPAQLILNLSRSINEGIEQSDGEINLDHSIFSELNFYGKVRLLLCCLERYG